MFCFSFSVGAGNRIGMGSYFSEFIKNLGDGERVASFVQTKTFVKYNKSFVVTGNVKFVKDVGLLWNQSSPRKFQFITTKDKYCLSNGMIREIVDLPYIEKVKTIVDEVVLGKYDGLYDAFDITYDENEKDESWKLMLVPKYSKMSQFIKSIYVTGDKMKLLDFVLDYVNDIKLSVIFDEVLDGDFDEIKC